MNKLKSYIALLLVGVLAINIFGYCMFSVLILTHKKSVFDEIISGKFEKDQLCVLKGSDIKNARWEHEKEFEWNEEMYDVVKKENKNGDIVYICKKDSKEDQLKKQKRKAAEKSTTKKMVEMTKIFVQSTTANQPCFIFGIQKIEIGTFNQDYSFHYPSTINPPPKA